MPGETVSRLDCAMVDTALVDGREISKKMDLITPGSPVVLCCMYIALLGSSFIRWERYSLLILPRGQVENRNS